MELRVFKILNYFFKTTMLTPYLYSCQTSVGSKYFQIKESNDFNSQTIDDGCYFDNYLGRSALKCKEHKYCRMMTDDSLYSDELITSWLEEIFKMSNLMSSFNPEIFQKHYNHNLKKIFSKVYGKYVKSNSYFDTITNNNLKNKIIILEIENWKNDSYPNRNVMEMRFIYLLKLYREFQVGIEGLKDYIFNYSAYEQYLDRSGSSLLKFDKNYIIQSEGLVEQEYFCITDLYNFKYNSKFFAGTIEEKNIKKFIDDYNRFSDFHTLNVKFRIADNRGFFSDLLYSSFNTDYNNSNFLLVKPSTVREPVLFENLLTKLEQFKVKEVALFRELPDYIIGEMYEHCAAREYGKFWYNYLQSFPTVVIILDDFVNDQDFKDLRIKMLEHRDYAKAFFHIPWNRNGIHCPVDRLEAKKNLETWLSFKGGIFEVKNFDNTKILNMSELEKIKNEIYKNDDFQSY